MFQRIKESMRIRSTRLFPGKMRRICISAPLASMSFDDVDRNALRTGADIVEAAGAKATYYISGKFCGQRHDGIEYFSEDDLAEAHHRGHDIGCHTFWHNALPDLSGAAIDADLKKNCAFIKSATGQTEISSFAYPYGAASIRTKLMLRTRFKACRGIEPGVNAGLADFSQLRAVCLEEHILKSAPIEQLIEQTCSRKGWLILVTHDISEQPTLFGCTPRLLEETLAAIKAAGIQLVTVKQALARIGVGAAEASSVQHPASWVEREQA